MRPSLETKRLLLTMAGPEEAARVAAFYATNAAHLKPTEPPRAPGFETEEFWQKKLATELDELDQGKSARFSLSPRGSNEIVGRISLTQIARGPFQACSLGYSIAASHEGKGLMSEALRAVIAFAFDSLKLHRIQANHLPTNERSGRLLRRLGFVVEGYARDYLFIDGAWRDHVLTSLTNPRGDPP